MRLSCGNDSFPVLPHVASVELIAELGFEGYDLSLAGTRSRVRLADVLADIPGWAARLQERVCGRGLAFSDLFHIPANDFETMAPNHPETAERDRGRAEFRQMLELAERLQCPGMTVLPGIAWPHESHTESLTRAAEELSRRVDEARERGVRLSIEPHVHSVCRSPEDIERLCDLSAGLELTLDYTHYLIQGFSQTELEPLLARARHVHVRGGDERRLQAPLKEGIVDLERLVGALNAVDYDAYIAVEYCWVDWEGLDRVDVISETVLTRDCLRAALSGRSWCYPGGAWGSVAGGNDVETTLTAGSTVEAGEL